jgi:hypothetical protein
MADAKQNVAIDAKQIARGVAIAELKDLSDRLNVLAHKAKDLAAPEAERNKASADAQALLAEIMLSAARARNL